ncbi:MAG: hypothetical protein F6K63_31515 [Moorea sp. SIO1G6]|uniref:hypothetical protein n=1 Tax=Moorena sp. SIO1G6 TaxID=2607840 RepID=UPI0013C17FA9|nr:hypothetical protein [Moorena sp. SIO1G6]NET68681.1 hypothetical protein [Moorena sp. SIO1G6]
MVAVFPWHSLVGCVRDGLALIFRLVASVETARPVTHRQCWDSPSENCNRQDACYTHRLKQLLGDAPISATNGDSFSVTIKLMGYVTASKPVPQGQQLTADR